MATRSPFSPESQRGFGAGKKSQDGGFGINNKDASPKLNSLIGQKSTSNEGDKSVASKGVDKGLDTAVKIGKGTVGGEAANLTSKIKQAAETAKTEGSAAAAADTAAAGIRAGAAATGVGGAAVKGFDAAKKIGGALGITIKDRYVVYGMIGIFLLQLIVPIFMIFVAVFFWENPASALSLGLKLASHVFGFGINNVIDHGGASQLAYEIPVSKNGVAQAAIGDFNPATLPTQGTYAWKLSQIDWEKAKYQTTKPSTPCNVITKEVVAPDGKKRSVIDRVEVTTQPGQALEGIAKATCIDKTYPVFNTFLRSQFIRDGINDDIGIRYAYAVPEGSDQLKNKTNEEVDTLLHNKTLDRIWQNSGKGVNGYTSELPVTAPDQQCTGSPDPDPTTGYVAPKNDELCQGRIGLFAYAESSSYTSAEISCANSYNFQNVPDLVVAINKAKKDLQCGIKPADLVYYYNLPAESYAKSGDDSFKSIQAKSHILRTICKINQYSLKDNEISKSVYRKQVKDRISSEENAALQALTYAHTNRDHFLNIRELSGDAYKVLGMGNSQEYQHAVNNEIIGEPTESDAISRIFGIANAKAYQSGQALYNDKASVSAIKVLQEINTATLPEKGNMCDFLVSKDFNDIYLPDTKDERALAPELTQRVNSFYDNYYPDFKKALATLDSYNRDINGHALSEATAVNRINMNDILTRFIRINANASTAGTEEGTQGFNRMGIGIKAYNTALSLAMGGNFQTPNQAVISENKQRSVIAYEDQYQGILWRLFDSKNPGSVTSRVAVALTDKPDHIISNVASVMGNFFNPAKNLVGSRSSLAYSLTGHSNIAMAAESYDINNLRLDPASVPENIFKDIDPIPNAKTIESLISDNPQAAGLFFGWEMCFRENIPSRFHLLNPEPDKKDLYTNFCREIFDTDAVDSLTNSDKFIMASIASNSKAATFTNPAVRRVLSFMYRAYHFNSIQADTLLMLSNPGAEDKGYNDDGSDPEAILGENDTTVAGVPAPEGDRNAPCPDGSVDAGTGEKYGVGRVLQYTFRLCKVQGITVNVTIAGNLVNLMKAASAAGLNFTGGGYRTFDSQVSLRKQHGCANLTLSSSACHPPTAIPGQSNHESGEAIDFGIGGKSLSSGSPGFLWLKANAGTCKLLNFPKEAWHWSKDGR